MESIKSLIEKEVVDLAFALTDISKETVTLLQRTVKPTVIKAKVEKIINDKRRKASK